MQLTIWCLKVQSFSNTVIAPRAPQLIDLIGAVLAHGFNSRSVENEALRCYEHLLDQVPDAMAAKAAEWGLRSVELITSDAVQVREMAMKVIDKAKSLLVEAFQMAPASGHLKELLSADQYAFPRRMVDISRQPEPQADGDPNARTTSPCDQMARALGLVLELMGPAANVAAPAPEGARDISNQLLRVLEGPLARAQPARSVIICLETWGVFIDTLVRGGVRRADQWSTLLLPIHPGFKARSKKPFPPECLAAHVTCMWRLVSSVDWTGAGGPVPSVDDVVVPLLRMCFSGPDGAVTSGIEVLSAAVLANLLVVDGVRPGAAQIRPMHTTLPTDMLASSTEAVELVCAALISGVRASEEHDHKKPVVWLAMVRDLVSRIKAVAGPGPAVLHDSVAPALFKPLMARVLELSAAEGGLPSCALVTLAAMLDEMPPHLLFAAQCRIDVPTRDGGPFTALQVCARHDGTCLLDSLLPVLFVWLVVPFAYSFVFDSKLF